MEANKYTPVALARLPREELRRMLSEELHKSASEINDDLVRLLMTELNNRGPDPSFADDGAVVAACEKFQEDTPKAQPHRKRWYQSWMLKVASVVLMLGILFFALPGAAQADDIHEVLSWWSDGAFRFFNPGKQIASQSHAYETDHPGLQQIYDTVTELGITDPVVPRWVPDGFELTELKTYQFAEDLLIHGNFTKDDRIIQIFIVVHSSRTTHQHEKDDKNISTWDLAGNEHYVVANNQERIVTWYINGIECTITTDCSEEDAYRIVKSIYTSEG